VRRDNFDAVTTGHDPAAQYAGENAFPRHDAIPDGIENMAAFMADLADLRHFQEDRITDAEVRTHGERGQIDAFRCQVLREVAVSDIEAPRPDFLYTLYRQETQLPDPGSNVAIALKTEIFYKDSPLDVVFLAPFSVRLVDGQYPALTVLHDPITLPYRSKAGSRPSARDAFEEDCR
jgi:hypothetical protein